jgi:hypothetical protein
MSANGLVLFHLLLQLGDLKTRGGSAQAALLDITSGAIKSFRVKTISALALAYLPSFALDAMFVSIVPSQHLRIAFSPRYEAPGFLHPSTATQVGPPVDYCLRDGNGTLGSRPLVLGHVWDLVAHPPCMPRPQLHLCYHPAAWSVNGGSNVTAAKHFNCDMHAVHLSCMSRR